MPAILLLTIHWIHMPSRDHQRHKEVMDLLPGILCPQLRSRRAKKLKTTRWLCLNA